jgi:hypothetical protein
MLPVDASARTARVVEGDFVLQVRVRAVVNRDARPPRDLEIGVGAGLYYLGEKQCYGEACVRHQTGRAGKRKSIWNTTPDCMIESGREIFSNQGEGLFRDEPFWFRLSRTGTRMVAEHSPDGKKWTKLNDGFEKLPLPAKLTVGVFAMQNTGEPAEVLFDEFQLSGKSSPKP